VYILGTDLVSNLRRKKPHPKLLSWIESTGWRDIATTVLTVMEIQSGIERARRSDVAAAESMQRWLAGLLHASRLQVLALDTDAAVLLGRMYEAPALRHCLIHGPRAPDLGIAAIAIVHKSAVATGNSADFLRIHDHFSLTAGLYDPFREQWLVSAS
jgi:predicted nucleic acid-binding protein